MRIEPGSAGKVNLNWRVYTSRKFVSELGSFATFGLLFWWNSSRYLLSEFLTIQKVWKSAKRSRAAWFPDPKSCSRMVLTASGELSRLYPPPDNGFRFYYFWKNLHNQLHLWVKIFETRFWVQGASKLKGVGRLLLQRSTSKKSKGYKFYQI